MAKRQKLDQNDMGNALERAFHVQELLTIPEGSKLRKLDDEMSSIIGRKGLSSDEKVRLFENKLAEFRQVQKKIVNNGGVNMTRENDSPDWKKMFESVVDASVAKYVDMYMKPAISTTSSEKKEHAADVPSLTHPQPKKSPTVFSTPIGETKTSSSPDHSVFDDAEEYTPINSPESTNAQEMRILTMLRRNGMIEADDKKIFPADEQTQRSRKAKEIKYADSSFNSVMAFFKSQKAMTTPKRAKGLVDIFYKAIKEESSAEEFQDMLKMHPNLKRIHDRQKTLDFDNWSAA